MHSGTLPGRSTRTHSRTTAKDCSHSSTLAATIASKLADPEGSVLHRRPSRTQPTVTSGSAAMA